MKLGGRSGCPGYLAVSLMICSVESVLGYGLDGNWSFVGKAGLSGAMGNITGGSLQYDIEPSVTSGFGGLVGLQWTSAINGALNTWGAQTPFTFTPDTAFTINDITFKAALLSNPNTWASTSPDHTVTFNTGAAWGGSAILAQAVTLHEIGHSLGLNDMYVSSTLPADQHFFGTKAGNMGHNAVPGTLETHGNSDNAIPVMHGVINSAAEAAGKLTLKTDDIAGLNWLYGSKVGSSLACIDATGGSVATTDLHHGDNNNGLWTYSATIMEYNLGESGIPVTTLEAGTAADGVVSASIYDLLGNPLYSEAAASASTGSTWDILFLAEKTLFYAPQDFQGDFKITLQSIYKEERIMDWSIGAESFSHGQTFGPVPEPSVPAMLVCCVAGIICWCWRRAALASKQTSVQSFRAEET